MARIRTIKPEFPQSESVGRLSRDARLLFIQLWTIADDEGRARAASRMLASLLYPYDDDAPRLIDGWLEELEAEQCVTRYEVNGTRYLQITKFLDHQKIDKPTKSRLPPFSESSRIVAKPREESATDLVSSTLDLVPSTKDLPPNGGGEPPSDPRTRLFKTGLSDLVQITGRTPDSARAMIGKWLKSVDDDAIYVLGAIEDAKRNRIADPVAWIGKSLSQKGNQNGRGGVQETADGGGLKGAIARLAEREKRLRESADFTRGPEPPRLLSNGRRE